MSCCGELDAHLVQEVTMQEGAVMPGYEVLPVFRCIADQEDPDHSLLLWCRDKNTTLFLVVSVVSQTVPIWCSMHWERMYLVELIVNSDTMQLDGVAVPRRLLQDPSATRDTPLLCCVWGRRADEEPPSWVIN